MKNVQYRLRSDERSWILEVGAERQKNGKPTPFAWKREGYYTHLEHALTSLFDRSLRDQAEVQDLITLNENVHLALAKVLEVAEDLKARQPRKNARLGAAT